MSAILPPAERLWYRHPIDRVEGTWIAIALTWCLIMFGMMVGWHIWGKQNLSTETYRTTPEKFSAKAQAMLGVAMRQRSSVDEQKYRIAISKKMIQKISMSMPCAVSTTVHKWVQWS